MKPTRIPEKLNILDYSKYRRKKLKPQDTASNTPPASDPKTPETSTMQANMMPMLPNGMNMPVFNPWMQPNIMPIPFPSPAPWSMQVAAPPVIPAGYQLVPSREIPLTPTQLRHRSNGRFEGFGMAG